MNTIGIALKQIEQNENSRVVYKEEDLSELMDSMRRHTLLQPVGLRKLRGGKYESIWGNRRILAAKKLGWHDIPAIVLDTPDDIHRDILNLVENFKRRQTTVAEDGRMFASLMERGLSEREVAARLGVQIERVMTALEVYNTLPKAMHSKIKYMDRSSGPRKSGAIAASSAKAVLNIRSKYHLGREQTNKLLEFSSRDGVNLDQLTQVAPLLKQGMEVEEAIEKVSSLQAVHLHVLIKRSTAQALERKYKKNIRAILRDELAKNSALGIYKRPKKAKAAKSASA